ncbi:MAG: efflux RND transporter periplasmic adaptor subunit [Candidatus Omnitrophica bacterium]|nr:efflux RND transporter periplasmic adaptor subunit [Candidatus Omnitrophota bacterium]
MRTLILLTSIFMLFGCQQQQAKKGAASEAIPVKVIKVGLRELNQTLEYAGDIKAQDEVKAYPKVSGKIIEKIKEEGAAVDKGDVVAYIDRDEVGLKFQKAPVESPVSGVVGRIYVGIGTNVTPQTPIALVVKMDKVKINLDIPEIYLAKIYLGQEANIEVDSYAQESFLGRVTKISPVLNLENRAAPVEITIDNPQYHLKSGMFAKVSLALEKRIGVPVILKEAIIGKAPDAYVYLIQNNKAAIRKIELGIHDGPFYEVTQGLGAGDLVVIMGQQRLYENAQVAVEIGDSQGGRE